MRFLGIDGTFTKEYTYEEAEEAEYLSADLKLNRYNTHIILHVKVE